MSFRVAWAGAEWILPRADWRPDSPVARERMDVVLLGDLSDGLEALERFERHTGLEFGVVSSTFGFHFRGKRHSEPLPMLIDSGQAARGRCRGSLPATAAGVTSLI
jgi:hypothetical protein